MTGLACFLSVIGKVPSLVGPGVEASADWLSRSSRRWYCDVQSNARLSSTLSQARLSQDLALDRTCGSVRLMNGMRRASCETTQNQTPKIPPAVSS